MSIAVSNDMIARALQIAAEFDDHQWTRGYDAVDYAGQMADIPPPELTCQTWNRSAVTPVLNPPVAWCLNGRLQVGVWTALQENNPDVGLPQRAGEASLILAQAQAVVRAALRQHTRGAPPEVAEAGLAVWNDYIATGPSEVREVLRRSAAQARPEDQA